MSVLRHLSPGWLQDPLLLSPFCKCCLLPLCLPPPVGSQGCECIPCSCPKSSTSYPHYFKEKLFLRLYLYVVPPFQSRVLILSLLYPCPSLPYVKFLYLEIFSLLGLPAYYSFCLDCPLISGLHRSFQSYPVPLLLRSLPSPRSLDGMVPYQRIHGCWLQLLHSAPCQGRNSHILAVSQHLGPLETCQEVLFIKGWEMQTL